MARKVDILSMKKRFVIMLGPPGSGKGTQGRLLAKVLDYAYFSMGAVLREIGKSNTDVARQIKSIIDEGKIIPDVMIRKIFNEQIQKYSDAKGIVIDAFPRDIGQVEILNEVIHKYDIAGTRVVFLDVPKEKLVERIAERNSENTEKRADDDPSIIHTRFEEYMQKTLPLYDYFQKAGILVKVQGDHPIEEVHQKILQELDIKE